MYLVQQAFNTLLRNRTLIVIAHKLSTIELADQILVLSEDGALAETGTHGELLERKGAYFRLWTAKQEAIGWTI